MRWKFNCINNVTVAEELQLQKMIDTETYKSSKIYSKDEDHIVDMCGVEGKRRLCDLNVTSLSPALAIRHIRCVLLVNSPNKLNLLSWLLIYLYNK